MDSQRFMDLGRYILGEQNGLESDTVYGEVWIQHLIDISVPCPSRQPLFLTD